MHEQVMNPEGRLLIQVFSKEGVEVARREGKNLVVEDGKRLLAHRIWKDTSPKPVKYMQLGLGGTAAATTDDDIKTALSTYTGRQEVTSVTMSGTDTAKWEHTWTAGEFSESGVQEVGLFNATLGAGGTMFARFTFTAVNKTNSDTLKITWTLNVT